MHHTDQGFQPTQNSLESGASTPEILEKEKHARRFQRGLKWMGAGALTLVFSFAINLLCFQCSVDFHTPMYVLTSLGALACLKGMMDIF